MLARRTDNRGARPGPTNVTFVIFDATDGVHVDFDVDVATCTTIEVASIFSEPPHLRGFHIHTSTSTDFEKLGCLRRIVWNKFGWVSCGLFSSIKMTLTHGTLPNSR